VAVAVLAAISVAVAVAVLAAISVAVAVPVTAAVKQKTKQQTQNPRTLITNVL